MPKTMTKDEAAVRRANLTAAMVLPELRLYEDGIRGHRPTAPTSRGRFTLPDLQG